MNMGSSPAHLGQLLQDAHDPSDHSSGNFCHVDSLPKSPTGILQGAQELGFSQNFNSL
jgi:hypothetical protein